MHHFLSRGLTPRAIATGMAVIGFAFMLAMTLAQTARAAGPSLTGAGLHISTGALIDPVGRTWVSDHNGGFCRMTEATDDAPGTIDHPTQAGDPGARTCLGGLMPEAAIGPDAAGAPVFIDPTPQFEDSGDEVALVPDGASPSDSVWQLPWNPDTRKFETGQEIHMTADPNEDRPRPTAVSMGSDGNVYVVFQRSDSIQRIQDPAGDTPTVSLVAATAGRGGAAAVAAVPGPLGPLGPPTIVVAEGNVLTETLGTPSANPAVPRNAVPSTDYVAPDDVAPGGSIVSALAYRPAGALGTGSLYLGTADSLSPDAPLDRLLRYDAPRTEPKVEAEGFTMVGGVAVRPDTGAVLVLDDPAIVTAGEPMGMGRLFQVGTPYARISSGPSKAAGRTALDPSHTSDPTPDFTFTGDFVPNQECTVVKAGQALAGWQPCTSPYTTATLADDTYRFAVRSITPDGDRGRADVRAFTVDTVAPTAKPTIVSPAAAGIVSRNPYYEFEPGQGETEYGYECRFDAPLAVDETDEFEPCQEARTHPLEDGEHTLQVVSVDGAGNVGVVASASDLTTFSVGTDTTLGTDPVVNAGPIANADSVSSYARGLHIASGALEAPDGRLWVTDHNGGFCRIADPTLGEGGHIDHPERAGQPGPRTCLGGLLPEARPGADAAGQPALVDPTPRKPGSGDEIAYVPDGATKMLSLFRAEWNPATKRFDPLDEFIGVADPADPADGPRPTAAATGVDPDGLDGPKKPAVYYVTKEQPWIVRINNPGSNAGPGSPDAPTAEVVGYANDGGGSRRAGESIAVGSRDLPGGEKGDVVYIGEAGGITRLIPSATGLPAGAVIQEFVATPIALPGITAANAGLAYDRARNLLYVGSADGVGPAPVDVGIDRVRRYQVGGNINGNTPTYTLNATIGPFSMVGGIGLRADGRVLVTDDVAIITAGEPLGMGRLYQIGGPAARIVSGPSNVDGRTALDPTFTADRTPSFTLAGDGNLECWLRPATSTDAPAFAPCAGTLTPTSDLAIGEHVLTVRTIDTTPETPADAREFVPDVLKFTVDIAAPGAPDVTASGLPGQTSAAPWFTFTPAGEAGAGFVFSCSLNGAAEAACSPGRTYPLNNGVSRLASGTNSLRVRAIDLAGNIGAQQTFTFSADTSIPTVTFTQPAARSNAANTVFLFNASETGVTYGCTLDSGPLVACPDGNGASNSIGRAEYANLAEGSHTLRVQARDARGNLGPVAERTVIIDRTGPTVRFTAPGAGGTTGETARVEWTLDPASIGQGEGAWTYACTLDGQPLQGCANPMDIGGLADGEHTLTVTATDEAGNTGPTASRSWTASVPPAAQATARVTVTPAAPTAGVLGASVANTVAALRVDPTLSVAQVRQQGVGVAVQTTAGQTTVRIQVFAVTGGPAGQAASARAAKAKRTLVATVFKKTPTAKTYRYKLKDGKLRRLKPGRYVVEVRAGASRTRLGKAKVKAFVVRGR